MFEILLHSSLELDLEEPFGEHILVNHEHQFLDLPFNQVRVQVDDLFGLADVLRPGRHSQTQKVSVYLLCPVIELFHLFVELAEQLMGHSMFGYK